MFLFKRKNVVGLVIAILCFTFEAANPEIYLFPAQYRNLPIASVNIQVEIR